MLSDEHGITIHTNEWSSFTVVDSCPQMFRALISSLVECALQLVLSLLVAGLLLLCKCIFQVSLRAADSPVLPLQSICCVQILMQLTESIFLKLGDGPLSIGKNTLQLSESPAADESSVASIKSSIIKTTIQDFIKLLQVIAIYTNPSLTFSNKLFYPLEVLPELLVLCIVCFPGYIATMLRGSHAYPETDGTTTNKVEHEAASPIGTQSTPTHLPSSLPPVTRNHETATGLDSV